MKEVRILCDVTKQPGAVSIKRWNGTKEFNGVENEYGYEEMDINPHLLAKRITLFMTRNYSDDLDRLWKLFKLNATEANMIQDLVETLEEAEKENNES